MNNITSTCWWSSVSTRVGINSKRRRPPLGWQASCSPSCACIINIHLSVQDCWQLQSPGTLTPWVMQWCSNIFRHSCRKQTKWCLWWWLPVWRGLWMWKLVKAVVVRPTWWLVCNKSTRPSTYRSCQSNADRISLAFLRIGKGLKSKHIFWDTR